jgi:GTP-binding protein EngB required for normal cell division
METRGALAAILALVDIRHPAFPDDREMVDWARRRGIPLLVVATKADKITRGELTAKIQPCARDSSRATRMRRRPSPGPANRRPVSARPTRSWRFLP